MQGIRLFFMNIKVMKLLARLLKSDREAGTTKYSAAGCLLLTLVTVLLCALSGNAVFPITIIATELFRLSLRRAEAIAHVMGTVLLAVGAAAVFMLPAVFFGSPGSFGTVTMKVFESVLVLSMLGEDVPWKEMTAAMGKLRLPAVFVMTLDMTVRFLYLLGNFSNSVLEAVTLRQVGGKDWKSAGTGGILGNTFLKAQEMSKGTGEAMMCRCWDGEYTGHHGTEHERKELSSWAAGVILAAELIWFVMTQSWMG